MATFDINSIFQKAFGYQAPQEFDVPEADARQTVARTSNLGQPYYGQDLNGVEYFLPVRLNGYLVPLAVVSILCKKTIISTPLPERGGTVRELVSIDDYVINIKGILVNDDNTYPEEGIAAIQNIFLLNSSIELRSVLTDIFLSGEHKVVIKQINWPAVSGVEHTKPFEIDCESDMIYTLEAS